MSRVRTYNRTHLTEPAHALIETLARLRFATRAQLFYWSRLSDMSSIGRLTNRLVAQGLLSCIDVMSPRAYGLTNAGYKLTSTPPFRRRTQISVIQHYCHRNAVEIALREQYPTATLQSRQYCLQYGLLPARGEALVTINSQFGLVLIDDQLMPSERIERSWLRVHKPDQRDYQLSTGDVLRRWRDVVQHYFVFSTDAVAVQRHRAYTKTNPIPANVDYLKPIWGGA